MKRKTFGLLLLSVLLTAMPAMAEDIHCTGIWVGGVELTSQNDYTVSTGGMGILNFGYATYNPETKTLLLNQLLLNTDGVYNGIELLNNDDITIEFFGDNRFNTRRAIYKPKGYSGTITLRYAENYKELTTKLACTCTCACIETSADIYIHKIPIELSANCRYNESPYDIAALIARDITIDNATIRLKANTQKALKQVDNGKLKLIGNHIATPANATMDSEGFVTIPGSPLEIRTELASGAIDFFIGETQVNADNQTDIRSNTLKSGKIRFDRGRNTLVLDNVLLSDDVETLDPYTSMIDIGNRSNFKIELVGNNVIRTASHKGITLYQSGNETPAAQRTMAKKTRSTKVTDRAVFCGSGTLTMEGKAGISTWQDLYFDQAHVTTADSIQGMGKKAPAIEFNASEVQAAGISGFDSFLLTDCTIAAPANATYDEEAGEMTARGRVVITTNATAIKSTSAPERAEPRRVYSLDGRHANASNAARGIYIENGKKIAR